MLFGIGVCGWGLLGLRDSAVCPLEVLIGGSPFCE